MSELGIKDKRITNKVLLVGLIVVAVVILAFSTLTVGQQLSFAKKKHDSDTPTANSPSSQGTSGDTFSDGLNAGKAQGKTDAISGVDNNSCDVSSHSNDYCAGYKVGYRANHVITNLVR